MTQLTLARAKHLEPLMRLVADFHDETGIEQEEAGRRATLSPLLEGSPHGAVYLAGPTRAPIGHVTIASGWSLRTGGLEAFVDEVHIRPRVRGRGIGTEIVHTLARSLAAAGLGALHLEVARGDDRARAFCAGPGFAPGEERTRMTRPLSGA